MYQPIKKEVLETDYYKNNPYINKEENEYILLVDGHSLLKLCMVDKIKRNSRGETVGPIFLFLLKIKMMMESRVFNHVYVFWDGDNSGSMRWDLYSDYKKNRFKQYSEYDRNINAFVKNVLSNKKRRHEDDEKQKEWEQKKIEHDKENIEFTRLRLLLHNILEDLFIRQVIDNLEGTECDDLIAYFCLNKKQNQKVIIMTTDSDLHQLISDSVMVYNFRKDSQKYFHINNYKLECGIPYENITLKKILIGDTSDSISGVKGLGEETLYKHFPEIKEKPLTLDEIINRAKEINENRKKPITVLENIINGVSKDNRENLYEVNEKIINLKKPLLGKQIISELDEIMNNPLSIDDRSIENVYKIIVDNEINDLKGNNFSSFFMPFKRLSNKEREYYKNFLTKLN